MFEISSTVYEFTCPPDYHWLPSSHSLFENDDVAEEICSQLETEYVGGQLFEIDFEPERQRVRPR